MAGPKVFVASSTKDVRLAIAVQSNLPSCEVTLWDRRSYYGIENFLDSLMRSVQEADFGVFVFSPSDIIVRDGVKYGAVRDNVILELGAFVAKHGKDRTYIIKPKHTHTPAKI